jgi:cytochrome P450
VPDAPTNHEAMNSVPTAGCPRHALADEYNPFRSPQLEDPGPVWARTREAPVFYSSVLSAWVVSRYSDVVEVLRRHDTFGPGVQRKMFAEPSPAADALLAQLPPRETIKIHNSEPPQHTKLRRYLQPALMPRRVQPLEPEFHRIANELVDAFATRGSVEFYEEYAFPFPMNVIGKLIGLPEADFEQIKEWTDLQVQLRYGTPSAQEQVSLAQSQLDSFEYTRTLIRTRRANPGQDLLSWMIQDSDASDDPLTDDQLAAQVTTMITAGHETTAHFVTMLMHRLLTERHLWEALVADPKNSASLVEEGLRTDGPVQSLWRRVKHDTRLGEVDIPEGARIAVLVGSANLDDETFGEASHFEVGRANVGSHVAFGKGIHTCPGAWIARLEVRSTLEVFATRLPTLRLADEPGYLFKPGATQRMAERLHLEWDR